MSELDLEQLKEKAADALQSGDTEFAESLYKTVLELEPGSATALYSLGSIAFMHKDYHSATKLLSQAAEEEPEAVDIAFNLASAYAASGDRLNALKQLERATRFCADDPVFVPRIADMSIRLGEPGAAVTLLSRLQRLTPADQILLANAHGMLGEWRGAVNLLGQLHKSLPADPVVAEKLAAAAGNLRDFDLAIESFENYLKLITPQAHDYLRFADLLLIAQDAERCDKALEIAAQMGEGSPQLYLLKARTARLRGDYEATQAALADVLSRQANNGQAWSIKAEMASDDELEAFTAQLQLQLDDHDEMIKLNDRHQSLLYYAMADMQDRLANYTAAGEAMVDANYVQHQALLAFNTEYSVEATEQLFALIIDQFNSEVFNQADATISESADTGTPIFIVGMPRSGTTLVERILGQNEQVTTGGEQEAMEFVAAFHRQQTRNSRWPSPEQTSPKQWTELRQMYLDKLPDISKPIFTDKLPHNFRNVGLILKLFPEARIIQMRRDIRDVCLSIFAKGFSSGHNYANRWQDLVHYYRCSEQLMAHWSALESPRIMDLNYEDLVTDPQTHARALVEFCGLSWNDDYLNFHQTVTQSFTFSEMQVRQPIATKRIGRWQNYADFFPMLNDLAGTG